MQILELATGNVSLEFHPDEVGEVLRRLESFGRISRSKGAVHDLIKVDGVELILYSEWDEPCLIAASDKGSSLLRKLAAVKPSNRAA